MIEEKTIIKELREFVKKFTTNKQAANALKVTQAQLSTTLNGSVNVIPEKILKKLGYKSQLVYVPIKAAKKVAAAPAPKPVAKNVPAKAAAKVPLAERPEARESQRQAREPVVVTPAPITRDSDAPVFLDVNARD